MKKTINKVKIFVLLAMAASANLMAQTIVTPDGPTTFCDGGSVNLNATGGTNYQWYKDGVYLPGANNATLNVTTSGNYQVNGTSGWVKQSPTGGTTNLNDVYSVNNRIFIVGDGGFFRRSFNNGGVYTTVSTGATQNLNSVHFVDTLTGWVVGDGGLILFTADKGNNWTTQTSGTTQNLYSVHFVDATTGYACGGNGTILNTIDGGTTWNAQTSGTTQQLNALKFSIGASSSNGYAVGNNGVILRTTNGGATWTIQVSGTTANLNGVGTSGANVATVVGDGGLILRKSTNAGAFVAQTSGTTQHLRDCQMRSSTRINVVGDGGLVLRSTDSGANYLLVGPSVSTNFTGSFARSNTAIIIVGDNGATYRTTNSGVFWTNQNAAVFVNAADFYNGTSGIAVGNGGTIFKTTTNGIAWASGVSGTGQDLNGVFCFDANNYWAVGNNGTVVNSIDGGTTWAAQASGTTDNLTGVWFTSATNGFAIGAQGRVLNTTNGGATWNSATQGTQNLNAIAFADAINGYIVGDNGTIWATSNGGSSWSAQTSAYSTNLNAVSFSGINGVIAGVGGTVQLTADGGATWTGPGSIVGADLNGARMESATVAVVAGNGGNIFRTNDTGANWVSVVSGTTSNISTLNYFNNNNGYAMGDGFCLKYTTPALTPITQVTVQANPIASISADGPLSACQGNVLVLSSSSAIGNSWSTNQTSNSITVTTSGTYTLTVTSNNGCTATASVDAQFASCVPATQLRPQDCSNQSLALNSFIICSPIIGVTNYQWEIWDAAGATLLNTVSTGINYAFIYQLLPGVQYGTQYQVRVRAFINNLFSDFSPFCTLGTICNPTVCGIPTTQVRAVDCNKFNYKISSGRLVADPVPAAISYEYEFRDLITNALVASKITLNTNAVFFNSVSGLVIGQYNVTVRAKRGGVWGNFGPACAIGISSLAKEDGSQDDVAYDEEGNLIAMPSFIGLEMIAMPNPFNGETNVVVSAANNEDVQINIFDMTGRIVSEIKAITNQKFVIGAELENGVYIINATTQDGTISVFRIVKQ
jgi:photosystem II stability/assembly factor-like uncharacterized protein